MGTHWITARQNAFADLDEARRGRSNAIVAYLEASRASLPATVRSRGKAKTAAGGAPLRTPPDRGLLALLLSGPAAEQDGGMPTTLRPRRRHRGRRAPSRAVPRLTTTASHGGG